MLTSGLEWAPTWWHQDAPTGCAACCLANKGRHPHGLHPPAWESTLNRHFLAGVTALVHSLLQLWWSPGSHDDTVFISYYPSSMFLSLLPRLHSCPFFDTRLDVSYVTIRSFSHPVQLAKAQARASVSVCRPDGGITRMTASCWYLAIQLVKLDYFALIQPKKRHVWRCFFFFFNIRSSKL